MTTFRIKRHDLEPPLVIDVGGATGDFAGVQSWKVIGKRGSVVVFTDTDPEVEIVSPTAAVVTHRWATGETATAGTIQIEVEALWPSGRPQTFPPDDYNIVKISPDLG